MCNIYVKFKIKLKFLISYIYLYKIFINKS